ncbi:hypothetical protein ACFL1B_03210 [Nanoarchaeota archaeon]
MHQRCDSCGAMLGHWKLNLHGQTFCSFECMNKSYKLAELADLFQFG